MDLILTGINHRTAALDVREKLWFSDSELPRALALFKERLFSECFIVSTCNRTELYGMLDGRRNGSSLQSIADRATEILLTLKSATDAVAPAHLYHLFGYKAAAHLFKVAGGIDSMVVGDIQILNQIKGHYNLAVNEHTTGTLLNRLVQTSLHVGKRVRTETTICEGAVSVSYVAVELANKIFSNLSEKRALLIGAGETGELTAKNLAARGIASLSIANRTRSKAEDLARELGGTLVEFDQIETALTSVDVLISSVASPGYILSADQARRALRARSNSPLLIIDIGVPRNVDPEVDKLENVFLHDLDSLSMIVVRNLQRRKAEIAAVNAIVLEELGGLKRWFESLQVGPTISDLHELFEAVRSEEVKKHINRFSPADKELIELITRRIVNKLLHVPTTNLKNGDDGSSEERHKRIHTIRSLFGLHTKTSGDEETEPEAER